MRRWMAPLALAAAGLVACTSPGRPVMASRAPASPSPVRTASPISPGPIVTGTSRVTFDIGGSQSASGDAGFVLDGTYPREASRCVHHEQPVFEGTYPGTLVVTRESDATLTLTDVLPFEQYLQGIAEVPPSWPAAALEAQVIAARSYALASIRWTRDADPAGVLPTICSTQSCQVYRGLSVVQGPDGERWRSAVERTAGQVLVSQGRPADALYFSTSNGHTYGNDLVFGGSPLPYLRPRVEHDDDASPLSHWRSTIRLADLARFLAASGDWPEGRRIASVGRRGDTITVRGVGSGGPVRTLDELTFRADVNAWAPCLVPARYPPLGSNGNHLPTTIPSRWFGVSRSGAAAAFAGRGSGHGVGMVQWGAYGKAARGLSSAQILHFYYGGLSPVHYPEPRAIRVVIAEGLTTVTVQPSTAATIDGRPAGSGPWLVTSEGGLQVRVAPPV